MAFAADDAAPLPDEWGGEDAAVAVSRSPRPISRIAENVSIITAEQIALLNAHTLADVLQTVPGIQLDMIRTPGSFTFFQINGAENTTIKVLIDGVPQNGAIDNKADVGMIPVQQIERIEIIKGAASALWGSALGGVVNVITKSPAADTPFTATVSTSYGERTTNETKGEMTGTVNRFGYYLSGGTFHSDGFRPGNATNLNNAFGKLTYDLPGKGNITLGGSFRDAKRESEESVEFDYKDTERPRWTDAYLAVSYPLRDRLNLGVNLHSQWKRDDGIIGYMSQVIPWKNYQERHTMRGADTVLQWQGDGASLTGGLDYEHYYVKQVEPVNNFPVEQVDRHLDRVGVHLNGSYDVGALTILPGIRFDHTGIGSDGVSYTLGATYRLSDTSVLRGYGARGYSLPLLTFQNGLQKIWTVQAGGETSAVPYVWLKGTLFYNSTSDIEESDFSTDPATIKLKKQTKQGYELEARTVPFHGVTFSAGYSFVDARDDETHDRITGIPVHGLKAAITYRNEAVGLAGTATGNYAWWNEDSAFNGRYYALIWDLSLTQKLSPKRELSPELFFVAHNLFNGAQYTGSLFKNTGRWLEGGVRFRF